GEGKAPVDLRHPRLQVFSAWAGLEEVFQRWGGALCGTGANGQAHMLNVRSGNPDLGVGRILLRGAKVADNANAERREICEVLLGEVREHSGAIEESPPHKFSVGGFIASQ